MCVCVCARKRAYVCACARVRGRMCVRARAYEVRVCVRARARKRLALHGKFVCARARS